MSQDQSALNTQPATPAVVLTLYALSIITHFLKRANNFARYSSEFADDWKTAAVLTETAMLITAAIDVLSKAIEKTGVNPLINAVDLPFQTVAQIKYWLERTEKCLDGAVELLTCNDLAEFGKLITSALNLLTITRPLKANLPKQLTHRLSTDKRGYSIRVMSDFINGDVRVNPNDNPPDGYEQDCLVCGHRDFIAGVIACPECFSAVANHCRYVAIVEGV